MLVCLLLSILAGHRLTSQKVENFSLQGHGDVLNPCGLSYGTVRFPKRSLLRA